MKVFFEEFDKIRNQNKALDFNECYRFKLKWPLYSVPLALVTINQ